MIRFLVGILLSTLLILPAHAGQELTIAVPESEPAYFAFAVLKEAYARIGIKASMRRLPAPRCLVESNGGTLDGEADRTLAIEDQYNNLIRVPTSFVSVLNMAFTCRSYLDISSVEDISQYRVGILNGFKVAEEYTHGFPNLYKGDSWSKLLSLLEQNRLDIVIAPKEILSAARTSEVKECVRMLEPPLIVTPLYHYLNKKHAALVPQIDSVLKEMVVNGEIEAIKKAAREQEKSDWEDGKYNPEVTQ